MADLELPSTAEAVTRFLTERFGAEPDLLSVYAQDDWFSPAPSDPVRQAQLIQNPRHNEVHQIFDFLRALDAELHAGDQVLIMSNGAFGGIHERLLERLARRNSSAKS